MGGKPLVAWAAERARASGAAQVVVATDHADIERAMRALGIEACMTSEAHPSGTDRIAEAARILKLAPDAIVVNVQGDEPLIDPPSCARWPRARAAARGVDRDRGAPDGDAASFFDPNVVKVVLDGQGFAHYFSRAPSRTRATPSRLARQVPEGLPALRHIGIYAYRVRFLDQYAGLAPTAPERFEALEQLRALGHGHRIAVALWNGPMEPGVDTAEDLERVRKKIRGQTPPT